MQSFTSFPRVFYSLPVGQQGTLTLYDASGRRIERVAVRGSGKVDFESALPSGVYIVRLVVGSTAVTKKAVVFK